MTITQDTRLFSPISVGDLQLKHRVVMAPLTRLRADPETAVPSDMAIEYYSQRASAGGLIISEGTFIAEEAGGMRRAPGIYSPEQIAKWKEINSAVHAKGGLIYCQLWALGRVADASVVGTVWGAGSGAFEADGEVPDESKPKPHKMTKEDIERFVGHYKKAAENAIEAGFDGVELHGANGYLLDQFLQSVSNDRTDEYGGSMENRFRFPLAVLNAVSQAIGPKKVGIRMSPFSHFQGMREEKPLDLFLPWTKAILKAQPDIAYVHAVEPRANGSSDLPKDQLKKEDTLDPIREAIVAAGSRFIVAGGFNSDNAKEHTESNDDLIAMGRYFIPNPDLPERIKNDWPLSKYDRSTFYTSGSEGYIDLPPYEQVKSTL